MEELLASFDFVYGKTGLEAVTEELEKRDISYTGYYNQSEERLDMILEDGTRLLFLDTNDSYTEPPAYDVITDEYYYPDLSERIWNTEELWSFNQSFLTGTVSTLSICLTDLHFMADSKFDQINATAG